MMSRGYQPEGADGTPRPPRGGTGESGHKHIGQVADKVDGFWLGVELGKAVGRLGAKLEHPTVTMAEMDAHYAGLLKEIEEMQEQLKAADRGQRTDDSDES